MKGQGSIKGNDKDYLSLIPPQTTPRAQGITDLDIGAIGKFVGASF